MLTSYITFISCFLFEFKVTQDVEAAFEAEIITLVTLLFMAPFLRLSLKKQNKEGLPYSHFRIRCHRTDLGKGGRFRD